MSKQIRKRYQQRRQLRVQSKVLHGMKEAREGIVMLQSLWPAAFPMKFDLVRPLAAGIIPAIAERTGWSRSYARGVVHVWKARNASASARSCARWQVELTGRSALRHEPYPTANFTRTARQASSTAVIQ